MTEKKVPMTLERYLLENCGNGVAKLRFQRRQSSDGYVYLRVTVRGLGSRPYAFRLEDDNIITAAEEAKRAKARVQPKKDPLAYGIRKGVE